MTFDFSGQVVLVTGASSGIGRSVARGFAEAGARVAIHYRKGSEEAESLRGDLAAGGADVATFAADLAASGSARDLVESVVDHFGSLRVVVNNAGAVVGRTAIEEADDDIFDAVNATNYRSVFEVCRAAVPGLRSGGGGAIVNVSSISARTGGAGGSVLYAAAKAAVATFTRGLAKELAHEAIRVNAVSPGYIDTPFHQGRTSPEVLKMLTDQIPMGRPGRPEECVGPVLFLADDSSSSYVTGQVLEVNGGQYTP